ncbi:elongation factor P 5-aminopentanone reductase [Clostridium polynesiense]|uniref:elongation factor P 5-aminopentanone reductase n=1 Tax=Clostridium polynesiense TaxID=1325933 RepID=UPI00058DDD7C|nr:SDR family oxidoreductase [Clostridium polynesiense]
MELSNKTAVITGASRGIGKAIALELSKAGAGIIVNYVNNKIKADEVVEEIRAQGGSAFAVKADVSDFDEAKELINIAKEHYGRVDILINNAGVSHVGLFMDMDITSIKKVLDTDVLGIMNTCHSVMNEMISRKKGVIINISSIWGSCGASCEAVYSGAKSAVNGFTRALAKELGPSNIRVNAIAPGVIETEMNSWLSEEEKTELLKDIPLGRFGLPEEVAALVRFLCSDNASYISGQIITIDGAMI